MVYDAHSDASDCGEIEMTPVRASGAVSSGAVVGETCAMCAEMYAWTSRCDWRVMSIDSVDVTHPLQGGQLDSKTKEEGKGRTCMPNNHSS